MVRLRAVVLMGLGRRSRVSGEKEKGTCMYRIREALDICDFGMGSV